MQGALDSTLRLLHSDPGLLPAAGSPQRAQQDEVRKAHARELWRVTGAGAGHPQPGRSPAPVATCC